MRHAQYLHRSRHGIYYFRVVVPKTLRLGHPALPKELKTSLRCSNRRAAVGQAQELYLGWLQVKIILENAVDDYRLSGFTLIEGPYCLLAVFFATAIIMPLQGLVIFGLIALFVDSSLRPPGGIGFAMNNNLEVLMIGGATAWIQ